MGSKLGERTLEGWQVSLKPRGVARFFPAAFLLFWLCGWAVGEGFVIWILVKGGYALLTGTPPDPGRAPLEPGPAVAAGAFLLFWLALWTLGGIGAIAGLLQLIWAEDRLLVHGSGLKVTRLRGPFRSRRDFPREAIRRLVLIPRNDVLGLETSRETVELSRLGTRQEREEAFAGLRTELALPEIDIASEVVALPKGWEEVITPEGDRALVPNVANRRAQARVAGVVAMGFATLALFLVRESLRQIKLLPIAVIATLTTLALASGSLWLGRWRMEWRIGHKSLTLRRRFGPTAREIFQADRLELIMTSDSDGDEWCILEGINGPAELAPPTKPRTYRSSKNRRRIASVMRDPTVPRRLGVWLAKTASVPFEDRTTREAREGEIRLLRDQLEKSGRLGQLAGRFIDRLEDQKKKRGMM